MSQRRFPEVAVVLDLKQMAVGADGEDIHGDSLMNPMSDEHGRHAGPANKSDVHRSKRGSIEQSPGGGCAPDV